MADITIESLEKKYDEILHKVVQKLKELLGQLYKEKTDTQALMRDIKIGVEGAIRTFNLEKVNNIDTKQLVEKATTGGVAPGEIGQFNTEVNKLETELSQLLTREIFEYNQEKVTYEQEKTSVDSDATKIKDLISYIETAAGIGKSIVTMFGTKKKGSRLTPQQLEDAYKKVSAVHRDLQDRARGSERLRMHIEPMLLKIRTTATTQVTKLRGLIEGLENKIRSMGRGGTTP